MSRNHQVGILVKRHTLVPSPMPLLHSVCMRQNGLGNSINGTVPTSLPGGIPHMVSDVMFTALKTAPT